MNSNLFKVLVSVLLFLLLAVCYYFYFLQQNRKPENKDLQNIVIKQENLKNEQIRKYGFLKDMYNDQYFPKPLVDKVKQVLIEFSYDIETKKPKNEKELYKLSYKATIRINNLAREFEENGSEIETVARDTIGVDFEFIAKSYGYNNIDVEELIAPREW